MLSVPGLAKDRGSPICPRYFGNPLESTQFSGYRAEMQTPYQVPQHCLQTGLKAGVLITASSWYPEVAASCMPMGCCRTLRAGAWRLEGLHVVCADTTWCQGAFISLASRSLCEVLQAFQQLINANLCPCREQTVQCSHLCPRGTGGWDGSCVHPLLPPSHSGDWSTPTWGRWTRRNVCVCVSLRGYAFAYCAALKVCTFKYICLDASYGKQSHFSK